jgi:putative chitinase
VGGKRPVGSGVNVTAAVLAALGARDAVGWAPVLDDACARHGILASRRMAAFLANVLHDSTGLARLEEGLNYSAAGLLAIFGTRQVDAATAQRIGRIPTRPADREAIANIIHGGPWGASVLGNDLPGDGWRFRGRGLLYLVGKANYRRLSQVTGIPVQELPGPLLTRTGAANLAARLFAATGCGPLADQDDILAVRRALTGGRTGLAEVAVLFADAKSLLGG